MLVNSLFLKEIVAKSKGSGEKLDQGRYILMEQIGEGAESDVFKCEDTKETEVKYKM